jgi:diadenosine tetraphosphate (Ap4A) HIT family hydrolase
MTIQTAGTAEPACYACNEERRFDHLEPRERIAGDDHWRVAHCIGTALPGWLVLLPRRHLTSVAELTDAEAVGLGTWQVRLARALHPVTGCTKTYVVAFGEAEGFSHLHFHVIPRASDLADDVRGPGVFGLLNRPEAEQVTVSTMNRIAIAVRAQLEAQGGPRPYGEGHV